MWTLRILRKKSYFATKRCRPDERKQCSRTLEQKRVLPCVTAYTHLSGPTCHQEMNRYQRWRTTVYPRFLFDPMKYCKEAEAVCAGLNNNHGAKYIEEKRAFVCIPKAAMIKTALTFAGFYLIWTLLKY
uniref:Wsv306-like protein n=1 Tax=Hemigrapsus takanoi nimavirus TaxID=2133792 RepID=A0A401IP40_9VIRU|nr:wsv306-like protein [Hemigrapsus takanoi nimavirus]